VVTHLLGLPIEDRDTLHDWAVRMLSLSGDHSAVVDSLEYLGGLYDERTANPRDDIPTLLLHLDINGSPITRDQYRLMIHALFVAGFDTTTNAAANSLLILSRRRDLREYLIEDLSRLPVAIDDFLRFVSPAPREFPHHDA
jgi:cytochrome P450